MFDTLEGILGVPIPSFIGEDNLDCLLDAFDLPCHSCHSFRSCHSYHSFRSFRPLGCCSKGEELLSIFLHMAAAFIDTYYSEGVVDGNTLACHHSEAPAAWEDSYLRDTIHN